MSHKSFAAQPSTQLLWRERAKKPGEKGWPLPATILFVVVFNTLAWTVIVAAINSLF